MPRPVDWLNAVALVLALGAATGAALRPAARVHARAVSPGESLPPLDQPLPLADGGRALSDATGALIPLGPYRRVASGSLLADPLVLALCAPDEVVSFSARAPDARDAYRYAGKPSVDAHRVESLLGVHPDLVLVNSLGDHAFVERLRDAGLRVFDLGPMRGVQTFMSNVLAVGWLVGREPAARALAQQFRARLEAIARHIPPAERRSALYLGIHGTQMFGGTRGTSYHDVLHYAGLEDVAARALEGWPSYDPEQLLAFDPELIVGQTGTRAALCERDDLSRLRACSPRGQVIELDPQLLNDAGLGMLEASEQLHGAAYPERAP
ncbi:MAG TPA: ABC transporter substrate-binding protein [Polyangiaceae bacterium]|nr:ABC transporter substrate-binding protein [Polyangiaceae bacterium]